MDSFWRIVFVGMILIGIYILVTHSGGGARILGSLGEVTVKEIQALQGPVNDYRGNN